MNKNDSKLGCRVAARNLHLPTPTGPEWEVSAFIPRPIANAAFAPAGIAKSGAGPMHWSANHSNKSATIISAGTLRGKFITNSATTVSSGRSAVAPDFGRQFSGADEKRIATGDEGGLALAAIQGLNKKRAEKTDMLAKQSNQIQAQAVELQRLKQSVAQLEALVPHLAKSRAK